MPCNFDKDIIIKYAEGKADPLEAVFAEEHIKTCSTCCSLKNENTINKRLLEKYSDSVAAELKKKMSKRTRKNKYIEAIELFGEIFMATAGKPLSKIVIKKATKFVIKRIKNRRKNGGVT